VRIRIPIYQVNRSLRNIWSVIVKAKPKQIFTDDPFFSIGFRTLDAFNVNRRVDAAVITLDKRLKGSVPFQDREKDVGIDQIGLYVVRRLASRIRRAISCADSSLSAHKPNISESSTCLLVGSLTLGSDVSPGASSRIVTIARRLSGKRTLESNLSFPSFSKTASIVVIPIY
jgi:hypothetical protein